ncbi:MAG: hypothetical protein HWN68_10890, partial [Desulfobacterales bacterium]|nr:hypothetical protein [Desulfobacterales bacterium]
MTNEQYRRKDLDYCCAMCGGELVKKYDPQLRRYNWYCSKDNSHHGYQQKLSPGQALQRGQADEVIGPGAQNDLEKRASETQWQFSMIPKNDLGSFELLNLANVEALIAFARNVGLNAYLGHVCLYHGKPYPTVDGYYYLNNKRLNPYRIGTAPLDPA